MTAKKVKAEGLAAIVAKQEITSIQDLTMQDFFAAFALQGMLSYYGDCSFVEGEDGFDDIHSVAFHHANAMVKRRGS